MFWHFPLQTILNETPVPAACASFSLTLTDLAGWVTAKKLTLGHNFPAKKSGHSGMSLRC